MSDREIRARVDLTAFELREILGGLLSYKEAHNCFDPTRDQIDCLIRKIEDEWGRLTKRRKESAVRETPR